MAHINLNSAHILFLFLLFFLLHAPVHAQDDPCKNVDCGMGNCVPYNGSILGFGCVCKTGWKQILITIGPFTFPSNCVIPNCTINNECGNSTAPPPPPPPPPPFNLTDPCNFVVCGDGTCIANGTGHYCQCNAGAKNLFNASGFACLKQCALGLDCSGLGLGNLIPAPSQPSNGRSALPPPIPSPPSNGMLAPPQSPINVSSSSNISKFSRSGEVLDMVLIAATIVAFFL